MFRFEFFKLAYAAKIYFEGRQAISYFCFICPDIHIVKKFLKLIQGWSNVQFCAVNWGNKKFQHIEEWKVNIGDTIEN